MSEVVKSIEDNIAKANTALQEHTAKLAQIEKARKQLKAEHEVTQANINVHNGAIQAFNMALTAAKAAVPAEVTPVVAPVKEGAK